MTTLMLVAVVSSSFITLSPEGVVTLLAAVAADFRPPLQLLNLFDVLILVNSTCNFFLYYTMNRQFRRTFQRLWAVVVARGGGGNIAGNGYTTTGQSGVFTDHNNKSETKHVFHNQPTLSSRC